MRAGRRRHRAAATALRRRGALDRRTSTSRWSPSGAELKARAAADRADRRRQLRPDAFVDEEKQRILAAVEQKIAGKQIVAIERTRSRPSGAGHRPDGGAAREPARRPAAKAAPAPSPPGLERQQPATGPLSARRRRSSRRQRHARAEAAAPTDGARATKPRAPPQDICRRQRPIRSERAGSDATATHGAESSRAPDDHSMMPGPTTRREPQRRPDA